MAGGYFGYIAAAYGAAALAVGSLGLWVFLDARSARARLATLEAQLGRRRKEDR